MPKDRGIYRNWGAFFDFGDVLEIPDPIVIETGCWSISVWLLLPITFETERRHTLVQAHNGRGAYLFVDETGSRLGAEDEETKLVIDSGVDLKKVKRGWSNIVATCDNADNMKITFYINGK